MSAVAPIDAPGRAAKNKRLDLHWPVMIGLLLSEVLALTLRVEVGPVRFSENWIGFLFSHGHWAISFGVTIVVLGGLAVWGVILRDAGLRVLVKPVGKRLRVWLPAHVASFVVFARLTPFVCERASPASSYVVWVTIWITSGLATIASWMLATLPPANWSGLFLHGAQVALVTLVFSVLGVLVGYFTSHLWGLLHDSTFLAVRGLLAMLGQDAVCEPEKFVVGVKGFDVNIAPECSGFEGIGLVWAFLGAYYWWFRHELRFPHALLLIPLGTALCWIFNVGRIAALIMVGAWGWENVAGGGFHSQAGWLAFNAIGLGLVALSRRARVFSKPEFVSDSNQATINPTAVYVAPLLAIALTTMVTGAFAEGGFDRLYPARIIAALAVFWYFRREYAAIRTTCSWHALALGVVVSVVWIALEPVVPRTSAAGAAQAALAKMPGIEAAFWIAARVIGSAAVVPVAEELAFRGYLTRRLIATDFFSVPDGRFTWFSFLVSSVLFGLLHQDRWPAGTIAGMLFALAYYRRGSVIDAIAAHATTNAILSAHALITGDWSHWG